MEVDMSKTDREFLLAHGYTEVSDIKEVICQGKVKDLHIDVYNNNPSMLLARVKERNAVIAIDNSKQGRRLTITQTDSFKTHLFSVPLEMITNAIVENSRNMKTILFNIDGDGYMYKLCYQN